MTNRNPHRNPPRDFLIASEFVVYMKPVETPNGTFYIGNCDGGVNLKGACVRFAPGEDDKDNLKLMITWGVNEKNFQEDMGYHDPDYDGNVEHYYSGFCDLDVTIQNCVFKMFFNNEEDNKRGYVEVNTVKVKDEADQRINNPSALRIFMRRMNILLPE